MKELQFSPFTFSATNILCKALKFFLVSAYFFIEKCFKSTERKKFNFFVVLCSLQSISLGRCALSCTRHQFFHTPFFLNLFLCQACMYHYQYALYMQHDCILMILYLRRKILVHSLHDLTLIHVEPDLNYPMEYEYLLRPVLPACTRVVLL